MDRRGWPDARSTPSHLRVLCPLACGLAVLATPTLFAHGLVVSVRPPRAGSAVSDSLERVPSEDLWISLPGRAVIRDEARWVTLWHRFGRAGWRGTIFVRPAAPDVDFEKYMLIAVSMGRVNAGCSNTATYIQAVEIRQDSVVVNVGRTYGGPGLTCMMVIEPVDVVRVPRSEAPVVFRPHADGEEPVPGPAAWWRTPSLEELERMENRGAFLSALALDPATPGDLLRAIAQRPGWNVWLTGFLLRQSAVRDDPASLYALAQDRGVAREARRLLMERHGVALAGVATTRREVLELLIAELRTEHADPRVPELLLGNPTVRDDRKLLTDFIYRVQNDEDLRRRACRAYRERWPEDRVTLICSR